MVNAVKLLLWARVTEVHHCSHRVHELLAGALQALASPSVMHAVDAEGDRVLSKAVGVDLMDASMELAGAFSCMEAAELLAATGDDHLRGDDRLTRTLRRVLARLPAARALAQDALGRVERCQGLLWAAAFLACNPGGAPGALDRSIEAQRLATVGELETAVQKAAGISPAITVTSSML